MSSHAGGPSQSPGVLSLTEPTCPIQLPPVINSRPDRHLIAVYRKAVRRDILAQLPSVAVGQALVQFDMDNVAWMHWWVSLSLTRLTQQQLLSWAHLQ